MDNDFLNSLKVHEYETNDTEKELLYRDYVESQKSQFEAYINFLNCELCVLKDFRIVSDFTRFLARIKSVESSVKNDKIKALNDVFGLEIDSATPGESAFVVMLFSDTLARTKEIVHNKSNKYVAYHYSGYPKAGNIVEKLEEMFNTTYNPEKLFEDYIAKQPLNVKIKLLAGVSEEYIKKLPVNLQKKLLDGVTREEIEQEEEENENIEEKPEEKIEKLKIYFENFCNDLNNYISTMKIIIRDEKLKDLKKELRNIEQKYHKSQKFKSNNTISDNQPIIEGQFKTIQTAIEANIGSASHGNYKGDDIRKIQKEYDRMGGLPLSRLPIMYESYLKKDENGKIIPPKIISSDETIKALYPSLVVKREQREKTK